MKPTFIDLFCGCGGFSLGMENAQFQCLAAIDFNIVAKHESSGTMANEVDMCRGRTDTVHFPRKILGASGQALVRWVLEAQNTNFRIRVQFG